MFHELQKPQPIGTDAGKLILRLFLGILLLLHGMAKIQTPEIIESSSGIFDALAIPPETAWLALLGELLAPLLLVAGVLTRFAGIVIALQMFIVMAFGLTNQLLSFLPMGGYALELQAMYLGAGVAIAYLGSGVYALVQD